MKTFLTAEWNNLINITYSVSPEILIPYLPKGLDLDIIDGKAFVSIVAFEFNNTRLRGIKIPFHRNFSEINLRFYVNHKGKRGVVFIKEFVPKYFVALVANKIYNEPYASISMNVKTTISPSEIKTAHAFSYENNRFNISLAAENKPFIPHEKSMEHFFKEHEIGYGTDRNGKILTYCVQHPIWRIYPVNEYKLDVDFEKIYDKQWGFLNYAKPYNILLAEGSPVAVYNKMSLA